MHVYIYMPKYTNTTKKQTQKCIYMLTFLIHNYKNITQQHTNTKNTTKMQKYIYFFLKKMHNTKNTNTTKCKEIQLDT